MSRLIWIILLIVPVFGRTQVAQEVVLRLLDSESGNPVAFEKCKILEEDRYYKTDIDGIILLKNYREGVYRLELDSSRFDPYQLMFSIKPNQSEEKIMVHYRDRMMKEVIVNHEKEDISIRKMNPIEGMIISQGKKSEVIDLSMIPCNKATNTGRQIYSRIPGLNIWESDGAGIQLGIGGRGLSPSRSSNYNTRQNGYDISADALGYPESYYTPASEAVEEIQLIRGAASLQFGTQFGGLLNFVMKKGPLDKKIQLTARHTIGSFGLNSSFISLGGTISRLNYYTYYQYKFGNDFRPNAAFNLHAAGGYFTWHASDNFRISADFTKMYYLTQQPGGLTDAQFLSDPYQSNRERNWFEVDWNLAALQFDYEFNAQTRINSRFFGLIATRKALGFLGQINRVDPLEERNLISGYFKNFGNETRFLKIYKVSEMRWAYVAGFRYYQGYSLSEQGLASAGYNDDFNFLHPDKLEGSSYQFPSKNISLFAEHIFSLNEKFSITPGVRFEYINTTADGYFRTQIEDLAGNIIFDSTYLDFRKSSRSFIIGGIGLNYKMDKNKELYANLSQNYRSINFTDMQIQNPNFKIDPNLEDEKGLNADVGIRGRIKDKVHFDVSAFWLYYQNRIGTAIKTDTVLFNTFQYRTNIAASNTYGIEAVAEVSLIKWLVRDSSETDLSLFANLSLVDSRYSDSEEAAFEGKKVELVPPLAFKTGLTYQYRDFKASYQFSYTHEHFSDATNSMHQANAVNGLIPSYFIMDLSLQYCFRWFQIEAGVNNLTNEKYFTRRATGYPGPGILSSAPRNYYLTLQIQL